MIVKLKLCNRGEVYVKKRKRSKKKLNLVLSDLFLGNNDKMMMINKKSSK